MTENKPPIDENWIDPDDAPEWTDEHFQRASVHHGEQLVRPAQGTYARPGRPKSDDPKKQVTLRLDSAVIEAFRATGTGWQSRINSELRKALGL